MNRMLLTAAAALACLLAARPAALAACRPTTSASPVIVGYFPSWGIYARNYHVADIDVSYPGDCSTPGCLRGSFHQLEVLKAAHPHLKALISIGGWTWSEHFSGVALTATSRQRFVQSAIDWEYPVGGGLYPGRPADRANFTLLMQEFRSQLDALSVVTGKSYELSIAVAAGPNAIPNLDLPGLAASVSHVNVMSYDYHGSWDGTTNFNAPLHASAADPGPSPADMNVEGSVRNYVAAGCPANQLVVGLPLSGRNWAGVGSANDGLYQAASGAGAGTFEPGMLDYWDIAARLVPTMPRFAHPEAGVPWLYSSGTFVTYDDPACIASKASFIAAQGLAGAMFWELSGDVRGNPSPPNSLLTALVEALCPDIVVPEAIVDLRMSRAA